MDKYLVSLAFILLCVESGWLLQDLKIVDISQFSHNASSKNGGESLGKIILTKKEVRRRPNSSLVWEETDVAQNLYAYDSILTLDQSAAELILTGDSHIILHENTLVSIEPPGHHIGEDGPVRLRFKQGTLKASAGTKSQMIDTGDLVIEASANSKLVVRSRGPAQYDIEALEGQAKVVDSKTHEVKQTVEGGQQIQIDSEKIGIVKEALKLDWAVPVDGARFYTHDKTMNILFQWDGKATGLEVFEPETNRVRSIPLNGSDPLTLPLGTGNYVVRIHDQTQDTFARNISIWKAPEIHLITPLPRERFKLNSNVTFRWALNPDVKTYVWEISEGPEFKHIIKSHTMDGNSAEVSDLPLGEYFWRVRGQDNLKYSIPELYNNSFYILHNPLDPPKLKSPVIKQDSTFQWWNLFFSTAEAQDETPKLPKNYSAEFQWEEVPSADSYFIEISSNADFRELLISENTKSSSFKWKNFPLGTYYWRVAARSNDGDQGLFSETGFANLKKIPHGPITQIPVPIKKGPLAQTPVLNSPVDLKKPVTLPKLAPEKVSTLIPKPWSQRSKDTWSFELSAGGSYDFSGFYGSDFAAHIKGFTLGTYRLKVTPPVYKSLWHFEAEFQKMLIKPTDTSAFPFQDILSGFQFRFSYIKENPFQNQLGYGFVIQNQETVYSRADLENLSARNPLLFGVTGSWQKIRMHSEDDLRLSLFLGEVVAAEGRLSTTFYLGHSQNLELSLMPELDMTVGTSFGSGWWFDAKALLLLGIRW